jgi:hypothetical protein
LLPESVAEYSHLILSGLFIVECESSTQRGSDTERFKVVSADD